MELEAEWPAFKNDFSIRPLYNRSLDVTLYDTYQLLLNTIGGDSWQRSGSALYYEVEVPQDGLYLITLRALQDTRPNFTVFRRITINDAVPFDEFHEVPFGYSTQMNRLSEGPQSAAQLLGSVLSALQNQPLALDKIYVHSPDVTPPMPRVSLWTAFGENIQRFIHSFRPIPYQTIGASQDEVEVWVNRPRQYVDLMQQMADQTFTPRTGIRVRFSIMPNEAKLALAIAANIEPDVALGISTNIPYELALRNALYDLRSFEDFDSFIRIYSPGSLLSYIINDSVYAIPKTQDFWVTFYRRDILERLGLPVPQTWDIVWYWNETYLTVIFLEGGIQTLPMQLSKFVQAYQNLYPPSTVNIFDRLNEAIKLAGTFLNILPLLVMYFVLQWTGPGSLTSTGICSSWPTVRKVGFTATGTSTPSN